MRIIGGIHRGKRIDVVKGLTVRPTTDFAKEALFNILNNKIDLEDTDVLDVFSGTGNISLEMASRGARVTAVDANYNCLRFVTDTAKKLEMHINTVKSDVFKFLKDNRNTYDLIFADPPYELENIADIHELVMNNHLLKAGGWLIIEHGPGTKLETLEHFTEHRKYGNVNFSFFNVV